MSDAELLRRLPGPDFPTGGIIMGNAGARDMYTTGRGSVVLRSTTSIEALPAPRGPGPRQAVIVSELSYGTAKSTLRRERDSLRPLPRGGAELNSR